MAEISFVPGAVKEKLWVQRQCENRCNEDGFRFFELATEVLEEEGRVRTFNLCGACCNKM